MSIFTSITWYRHKWGVGAKALQGGGAPSGPMSTATGALVVLWNMVVWGPMGARAIIGTV